MKFYWTIFRLVGVEREDGKIWVRGDGRFWEPHDKNVEGTVHDEEIIAVFKIKDA